MIARVPRTKANDVDPSCYRGKPPRDDSPLDLRDLRAMHL